MPRSLADFIGHWQINRDIHDHRTDQISQFQGTAQITAQGAYTETGQLILPTGQAIVASRAYHWQDVAGGIAISFDDGRPFHAMWQDAPHDHHWCDPDTYDVIYNFDDFPYWTAQWHVKGPRKDYVMISCYRKQGAGALN
ncbi:MAG: DUF6314 family protein [Pseudomonadota bacterium]